MSDRIIVSGQVIDHKKGDMFIVQLDETPEHQVTCKLAGKFRLSKISLVIGDSVNVELSPYDLNKGRIIWRLS